MWFRRLVSQPETIASKMLNCLFGAPELNDAVKANMASAQVLLGFLFTILTTVGCDPTETSVLSIRRTLLAMLVAVRSPAPSPERAFIYQDPNDLLKNYKGHSQISQNTTMQKSAFLAAQYFIVIVTVVNTVELALELGFLIISSVLPSRSWLVILWTILGVVVHMLAMIALRFRNADQKG